MRPVVDNAQELAVFDGRTGVAILGSAFEVNSIRDSNGLVLDICERFFHIYLGSFVFASDDAIVSICRHVQIDIVVHCRSGCERMARVNEFTRKEISDLRLQQKK